jgi:hypothetical protein
VQLSDTTDVAGTSWANLKVTAMDAAYDKTVWTGDDLALVEALIAAQTALLDDAAVLTDTPYTTGSDHSDATTLTDGVTTWESLKLSAMDAGYDISSLSVADQHLFNALKTAQTSQGQGVPLVDTPYSSETTCEIVDEEIEYDPKFEYTIKVPRSIYRKPWTFQQAMMQDSVANVLFEDSDTLGMPSNAPLSGYYFIECYEPNDPNPRFTDAIKWSAAGDVVKSKIIGINACPGLRNKFEIHQQHRWFEDSLEWLFFF